MASYFYLPDSAKPRHKQLKRLILAVRDLQHADSALRAAAALKDDDPIRSHLISIAVVNYARPFVSTRGFPRISGTLERFEDASFKKTHDFVCDWRDAAVAHSEDQLNDVGFIPRGSKLQIRTEDGKEAEFTFASHGEVYQGPKFPSSLVARFLDLCAFQEARIKSETARQKEELFHEFIKPAKRANKAPEPTPGSVTPRATEGDSK
jgi:hypothetical protein